MKYFQSLENLANIFKNLGDYKKLLDKILETMIELIHMLTFYKLLLILELMPICNINSPVLVVKYLGPVDSAMKKN